MKSTVYTNQYLAGGISVRRNAQQIYVDINTTTTSYFNPNTNHILATFTDVFVPIESLGVYAIDTSGTLAYVTITAAGELTINLNAPLDAGDVICIHAVFIAHK